MDMTANQIAYWNYVENKRANRAKEAENIRSHQTDEAERYRSNIVKETETERSNRAKEEETNRTNLANEFIGMDKNRITEEHYMSQDLRDTAKMINEFINPARSDLERAGKGLLKLFT